MSFPQGIFLLSVELSGTFYQGSCQCAADLGLLGSRLYQTMQMCRICLHGGNEDVWQV